MMYTNSCHMNTPFFPRNKKREKSNYEKKNDVYKCMPYDDIKVGSLNFFVFIFIWNFIVLWKTTHF